MRTAEQLFRTSRQSFSNFVIFFGRNALWFASHSEDGLMEKVASVGMHLRLWVSDYLTLTPNPNLGTVEHNSGSTGKSSL
jgi:hypothetical protein